jgi:hypothetical protein
MADVFESPALGPSVLVTDTNGVQRAVRPLVLVDGSGNLIVPQSDSTGQGVIAAIEATNALLGTPATSMPPRDLSTTKRLAVATANPSTVQTNASLVAGTASQTVRVYRLEVTVMGACLVDFLDASGGASLRKCRFPAAGAKIYDFSEEPWFATTAGNGLFFNTSAAVQVDIHAEYVKSA